MLCLFLFKNYSKFDCFTKLNNIVNFEIIFVKVYKMVLGSAMFGALSQLTEAQGFSQKPPNILTTLAPNEVKPSFPAKVDDPLRELVLYSNHKDADPEKLKFLALSAAKLATEEVEKPPNPIAKNMKTFAGIFTGTGAFIKNVEENISKKYSALDPSDSDGFGGNFFS